MLALLLFVLVTLAPGVHAGEVRMSTGAGGNLFDDPTVTGAQRFVNCNVGDHVVWVSLGSGHTCTSGDSATVSGNGLWDSGTLSGSMPNNGGAFSWQATNAGVFPFFCNPHAPPMAGRVIVSTSGAPVSDLRITEVLYNSSTTHDLIEVTNIGGAAGNLGRYRFSTAAGVSVSLPPDDIPIAPAATVTIHTNETGVNTATDVFVSAIGNLGDAAGALALYVANTKVGTSLNDFTQIVDYVEWGASGGANENVAVSADVWSVGTPAPGVATDHSIEFCGTNQEHQGRWFDNPAPNFGGSADNCLVPVRSSSWGRIKTLYR